ncbi:MAG: endopeptidase La [Polyangiaceae bacterium]
MFFKGESDKGAGKRKNVPLLPLRDIIVFPHMVSQLFVGRERSISALDAAMAEGKEIFLAAQKNAKTNEPAPEDIFAVGTIGTVMQLLRLPDGTVKVLVEGRRRARTKRFVQTDDFFIVEVEEIPEPPQTGVEIEALMRSVQSAFEMYVKLNKKVQPEVLMSVQMLDEAGKLSDTILANLPTAKLSDRQSLLETEDPKVRLERLLEIMQAEIEILQVEKKIRSRVKKQMERTQKEYYLNEQMQAIQKELGGGDRDEFKNELAEIEEQVKKKALSEEASGKIKKELKKLKMMHPTSAEATVVRNYIDWILSLPWGDKTEENIDLKVAEEILDEDHYGLRKIKERILEYLAVQALTKRLKGPVLCFVGPPGVGKTSLAKSIARATGRKFGRIALGGVRDEAEIRGHRRTYIGAMPGKLIQSLKKIGSNNPVVLLDEIDKMATDFRGDPAAALLEVLDREQNHAFGDHYLDLDYDLSDVMFLTTANSLSGIPVPLQDRMEIIELTGYTEFEKINIAVKYLLPRQRKECGLEEVPLTVSDSALRAVIHHYTYEAGVRSLEREIGGICRKVARKVLEQGKEQPIEITAKDVPTLLGVPPHLGPRRIEKDEVGSTNGLAVTYAGGSVLVCEVSVVAGKGSLNITGNLKEMIKESGSAAMSYVRSRAHALGLDPDFYQKVDVHVHFPAPYPKDGNSAGVTITTSLASALTRIPVRADVAMTGEVTLRGRVMPIGGVKEKLLGAHRAGIKTVLVPMDNRKDLREVPRRVLKAVRVVLVEHMDQVLREALCFEDPSKVLGPRRETMEYVGGELVVHPAEVAPVDPGAAPGESAPVDGWVPGAPGSGTDPAQPASPAPHATGNA